MLIARREARRWISSRSRELEMSHLKRIVYSISLASTITALALFFIDEGGPGLLIPGFVLELWLAIVFFIDPEEILFTSHAWGGNILAYSILSYGLSWLATGIRVAYFGETKSNKRWQPTPR